MKFRTDINGLRAYAVLAVMIFHFNKDWLPGGFAGVDVFFVISGYLMTSIIFRGIDNNNFSLWKFYSARISRIIPALLVLIIILMIFGYLFLAPIPYRELAKHSGGSLLFISNFMYWQEAGYFDAEAIEKFLLHTWSLSVEWQFYIIYPVILLLLAKLFSAKTIKKIIAIATIFAFFFTVYSSFKWNTASYFLLPSRIWEMLLGGIVFLYPLKLSKPQYKHTLELIGLGLIVLSFFIISEQTVWPGYMALIPTGGTFLLLQANNQTSYFTNNLVMQKLGLWSYSLYLYHWPLLVINHKFNLQFSIWVFLVITIVLSVLSYYFIEIKRWKVWHVLTVVGVILIPIGGVYITKGASFRVDPKYNLTASEFHRKYYGGADYPTYQIFFINGDKHNYDYLVIGDSFMRQYAKYFDENNIKTKNLFVDGCLIIKDHDQPKHYFNDMGKKCNQSSELAIQEINTAQKNVIWGQAWDTKTLVSSNDDLKKEVSFNKNPEEYKNALYNSIKSITESNSNINFFLIGQPTKSNYNIFECLSTNTLIGSKLINGICDENIPFQYPVINQVLKDLSIENKNVFFIDPNQFLCDNNMCKAIINGEPVYSDTTHLSIYGANVVGKYIFKNIDIIKNKNY